MHCLLPIILFLNFIKIIAGAKVNKPAVTTAGTGAWANSPRASIDRSTIPPSSELGALAEGIGESLMALDLPCIIAHKREAEMDMERKQGELSAIDTEAGIPAELLEPPQPVSARQAVQAHRILVTARSLRSVDTSPERATPAGSGESGPGGSPGGDGVRLADPAEVKTLLLQALLAVMPVAGVGEYPTRDPSPVLAAEVLSMPTTNAAPAQVALRSVCMEALIHLARNPAPLEPPAASPIALPSSVSPGRSMLSPVSSRKNRSHHRHVFLAALGAKLTQLLSGGVKLQGAACEQAAQLLQLAGQYIDQSQAPSTCDAAVEFCLPAVRAVLGALHCPEKHEVAPPEGWSTSAWDLIHGAIVVLGPTLSYCSTTTGKSGPMLVNALLGDGEIAAVVVAIAGSALLQGEGSRGRGSDVNNHCCTCKPSALPAIQRDVLRMLSSLATLIGKLPPMLSGSNPGSDILLPSDDSMTHSGSNPSSSGLLGRGIPSGVTRQQALSVLSFLVSPPANFVRRVLEHQEGGSATPVAQQHAGHAVPPPSSHSVRLRQGVFDLLKAVLSAPGNPFISNKPTAGWYFCTYYLRTTYHNQLLLSLCLMLRDNDR